MIQYIWIRDAKDKPMPPYDSSKCCLIITSESSSTNAMERSLEDIRVSRHGYGCLHKKEKDLVLWDSQTLLM
ncbi:hypothetical protein PVK06_036721 [Gossypium arboreum]|uniref:Uncharacterized protein n=1 Tax=Gossypium arboreum TaxID=29729 RepID=A0ABR0NNE4_GOSAR|nr:hypothetical protein PVK06_036721 [Gossypium arboreum]